MLITIMCAEIIVFIYYQLMIFENVCLKNNYINFKIMWYYNDNNSLIKISNCKRIFQSY